jgi:hypothetical protein
MTTTIQINRSFSRIDGKLAYHGKLLPPGPWHDEPDRVEFEHAGLTCLLVRGVSSWCGYVAVPPGHPWHGKGYDDVRSLDENGKSTWPDVHGGLTYADKCQGNVCHVAKPGESDDVWWLGFDCNHSGDLAAYNLPDLGGATFRDYGDSRSRYRDVEYTRREAMKLAEQARRVAP